MRLAAAALLTFALAAHAHAEEAKAGKLLAVLEFKNALPEADRALAGDRLRFAATVRKTLGATVGPYKVISPEEMTRLASANPEALDKCNDADCVAVGRLLGADRVVEGKLGKEGKRLVLTLRLFDTANGGKPLSTVVLRGRTADALLAEAARAASAMGKSLAAGR